MKTLLFCFSVFCFSLTSFAQIREEVVSRHEDGTKKIVITYSGVGNNEKILKISEYSQHYVTPYKVTTYGSREFPDGKTWMKVKVEYFDGFGVLKP
jgi:hypothetical protein